MYEERHKVVLVVKVDPEAIESLDRIAGAFGDSAAQWMRRFLDALRVSLAVVDQHEGDMSSLRDGLARTVLAQFPDASPEDLHFAASVWGRAAELKTKEGEEK